MGEGAIFNKSKKPYLAINWFWLLITLLVFFALVKLGLWQLSRADEKTQRLIRINTLQQAQAFTLPEIENIRLQQKYINTVNDLPVIIDGEFDENVMLLLDNQMHNGKFGYRVLQLLKTSEYALLVNLGWHVADRTRQTQPDIKILQGDVKLHGHVRIIEKGIVLADEDWSGKQWPLLIQNIDLNKLSEFIGTTLLPYVVYLDKNESIGYTKNWLPIVMPPEKHQGYAFQWFSLALAWLFLMVFAARKTQINKSD